MKASYIEDMTKGSVTQHLVKFAIPLLIGNVFQQFHNIVNSVVVSRYVGDSAFAGVGIVGSLNFLFFSMCMGLSLGVGIVVAHSFGANDERQVKKAIGNAAYLIIAVGVLMSILGICFAKPILEIMKTPSDVMPHALTYMRILCLGTVFVAGYNGISAILRALGDAKTPLIFLIISSISNVLLAIILVAKFDMGVAGVGMATVISQAISVFGSVIFALRANPYLCLQKEHLKVDMAIFVRCSKIGIPIGLQYAMIAISIVALQGVVNSFGTVTMAAFTATARIEQIFQQPFNAIGAALSNFTGQNLGIGNVKRVKAAFKKSMLLVAAFSVVTLLIFALAGEWVIGGFVNEPESIVMGAKALRITSIFYIALGAIYVSRGVMNGAGDGGFAFLNGVVEVCGRIGFSLILTRIHGIDVWGLWVTTGLTWLISGGTGVMRYFQGKWQKIEW
jgi:putative efflux protein, MATE family